MNPKRRHDFKARCARLPIGLQSSVLVQWDESDGETTAQVDNVVTK